MTVDVGVTSSVRRDLFLDKLKSPYTAWSSTMDHRVELVFFFKIDHSPYGSVGYNRNLSRVSAHTPKTSCTHAPPKRTIKRERSQSDHVRAIMSSKNFTLVKCVSCSSV
jgi:hypothetical protein